MNLDEPIQHHETGMQYRTLGKTGLKVSQLGFGAMRLPMMGEGEEQVINRELAIPMIHRAFASGVNYIDTAVGYCNMDSQRVVGEALKGWRDSIVVSTKNHYYDEDESVWWKHLEDSLKRLQIESIDIYNTHGVSWTRYTEAVEPRVAKWLQKAKDQGLIKHICTSFHDNNESLIKIVDTGFYDSVTLQYNILDQSLTEGIAHAHDSGMGVVVMGPVAGGRLGEPSKVLCKMVDGVERVPQLAMRFVLANPNVTVALSGMSTREQVEENIRVCADTKTLSAAEMEEIGTQLTRLKAMADLYCTGCRYCMPCPEGVPIPHIFNLYNQARVYGIWEHAKQAYHRIGTAPNSTTTKADACVDCGQCEEKCPQNIPIRKQLQEAHKALTR